MTEWREAAIGELAEKIAMGPFGSNIKIETFKPYGIPIISGTHLCETRMRDKDFNFISKEHADRLANSNVFRGDVIFTHAGNIGQVSFIPKNSKYERYIISQRQFYLRCNSNVLDYEYITYYFKSPYGQYQLLANANQTGVPSLAQPVSYLKSIKIFLPPLPEQKAIAEVLSSLDDKIDLLTRQNKTLEDLAQAYFRKWFVEDAGDEWEEKSLNEVVDILSGGTPSTKVAAYWDGNIPWFTPKDSSNLICMDTEKHITQEGLNHCNSRLYPAGTVFISARGTVGKLAICGVPMAMNQSCYALIGKGEISNFIVYLIMSYVLDELLLNASGAVFDAITTDTFKAIKLPLPPVNDDIFIRAKNTLSTYYEKIVSNTKQILLLQKLRDTLLPKLISGEIRVKM